MELNLGGSVANTEGFTEKYKNVPSLYRVRYLLPRPRTFSLRYPQPALVPIVWLDAMPRAPRNDEPGAWFHVMNRALARRTAFPDRRSIRIFPALLATSVRSSRMEIHAFTMMSTHYHLLVRSPIGEMSEAMRRTQNLYVRWFNRQLRRDGPLFRGRFLSKRIDSLDYRRAVVRYIAANAVAARLFPRSEDYPFASAAHHIEGKTPAWLQSEWISGEARRARQRHPGGSPPHPICSLSRAPTVRSLAQVRRYPYKRCQVSAAGALSTEPEQFLHAYA